MAGYFHLKQAANSQFMFNLKAANHQVILTSETYSSKAAAQKGIEAVRKNAANGKNYERKKASNGAPFFVLKASSNGQTVGTSERYASEAAMEKGIRSVMLNGPSTTIKEA